MTRKCTGVRDPYLNALGLQAQGNDEYETKTSERTYHYDSRGRCIQTYTAYPDGITCRTSVKYDYAGNPLTTVEQYTYGSSTLNVTTCCTFDSRGRKLTEQNTVNGTALGNATFTYDEQGRVTQTSLNGNIGITASYNLQGWMTALQATSMNGNLINTLFSEELHYYDTSDSLATPLYAGKIAQLDWNRKLSLDGLTGSSTATTRWEGSPRPSTASPGLTAVQEEATHRCLRSTSTATSCHRVRQKDFSLNNRTSLSMATEL